jgi:hypothetical protein
MSVLHEERQLSAEQLRALKLLADAEQQGCTGTTLFGHGFGVGMLSDLVCVWHGLAAGHRVTMRWVAEKISQVASG